jgi:hypothetical protein
MLHHTHTHTHNSQKHTYINSSSPIMPLEHVVTYQAFREITNFIRDNGDDWDEFCNNAARPSTTKKAIKPPPSSCRKVSRHNMAKTTGKLAAEPLLQANPHRFVLLPIQLKLPSGPLKKLTLQPTLRIGIDSRRRNNTSFYMFSPSSRPPTASSTRISVATSQPKSHHQKPDASTASRSPSKTSTVRRTRSSLTRTSRTP